MLREKQHAKVEQGAGSGTPSGGELVYSLPSSLSDVSGYEVLSFRVAQTDSADNPATGSQNFRVELMGDGKTKATYASRFDEIPRPYDHPYYPDDHNVMTTVRIPLHSFIMNNSGLPLDNVDIVRFAFSSPNKGDIYIDDIEFSR